MAKNDKKKDAGIGQAADLGKQAAAAKRRGARRETRDERTTLEMEDPEKNPAPDRLGELLVTKGLITRHQLFNALNESYRAGIPLREAIIALGYLNADTLASVKLPEE